MATHPNTPSADDVLELVGLIEDLRAALARGVVDATPYEAALARLEAEAARRGVALPAIKERRAAAHRAMPMDRDAMQAVLSVAATSQELTDFASMLPRADLQTLWFAYKQTRAFKDQDERLLALNHVAYFLTRWMIGDGERAMELELLRTERLSEASQPIAWLEQELLRMFGQMLRVGEDPTGK